MKKHLSGHAIDERETAAAMLSRKEDRQQFASDLVFMKDRAARLQLWKTMQALEVPIRAVGWEIAEKMEKRQ